MFGEGRRREWSVAACLLVVPVVVGCGGDGGPDGRALAERFSLEAEAAYARAGADREEDFLGGVAVDCFVLDRDGADKILDALGVDGESPRGPVDAYLIGAPGRTETLSCHIVVDGQEGRIGLSVGPVTADRDQIVDNLRDSVGDEDLEAIDAGAPGLDGDLVYAVTRGSGQDAAAGWVDGGFSVVLNVPGDLADPQAAPAGLSVAVGAVTAALHESPNGDDETDETHDVGDVVDVVEAVENADFEPEQARCVRDGFEDADFSQQTLSDIAGADTPQEYPESVGDQIDAILRRCTVTIDDVVEVMEDAGLEPEQARCVGDGFEDADFSQQTLGDIAEADSSDDFPQGASEEINSILAQCTGP
jgi:hypothetical protein